MGAAVPRVDLAPHASLAGERKRLPLSRSAYSPHPHRSSRSPSRTPRAVRPPAQHFATRQWRQSPIRTRVPGPSEYVAAIDWGDGSPRSAGSLSGPKGGRFTVNGDQTYGQAGSYAVQSRSPAETTQPTPPPRLLLWFESRIARGAALAPSGQLRRGAEVTLVAVRSPSSRSTPSAIASGVAPTAMSSASAASTTAAIRHGRRPRGGFGGSAGARSKCLIPCSHTRSNGWSDATPPAAHTQARTTSNQTDRTASAAISFTRQALVANRSATPSRRRSAGLS